MIFCLYVCFVLNYITLAFEFPMWVSATSYVIQLGCLVVAEVIWEKQKAELDDLKREVRQRKK